MKQVKTKGKGKAKVAALTIDSLTQRQLAEFNRQLHTGNSKAQLRSERLDRASQAERERKLSACAVLHGASASSTNGVQVGQWHLGKGKGKEHKGIVLHEQVADLRTAQALDGTSIRVGNKLTLAEIASGFSKTESGKRLGSRDLITSDLDFDKPAFELQADYEHFQAQLGFCEDETLTLIDSIAWRSAYKAVAAIANGRGKRSGKVVQLGKGKGKVSKVQSANPFGESGGKVVSSTSLVEAFGHARYSICLRVHAIQSRLRTDWTFEAIVKSFFDGATPQAIRRNRRLRLLAWRAAYASISELPNGMKGKRLSGVRELIAPISLDDVERTDSYSGEAGEASEIVGIAGNDMQAAIELQLAELRRRKLIESEIARQAGVFVQGGSIDSFEFIDGVMLRKRHAQGQGQAEISPTDQERRKAFPVKANSFEIKTACKLVVCRLLNASWSYQRFVLWNDTTPNNLTALASVKRKAKLICLVLRGVKLKQACARVGKVACYAEPIRFAALLGSIGVDTRGLARCFAKGY